MNTGSVIGLVTLFLSNNIQNDLDPYKLKYTTSSNYYFYNDSDFDKEPSSVEYNYVFQDNVLFPKCCPPNFLYEAENRDCVEAKNVSQLYQDLNINVTLVRYGLDDCAVVIDRLVPKNNLKRSGGNGSLVINGETFPDEKFCVDKVSGNSENYVIRLCQEREYCFDGVKNNSSDWCIYKCCPDTYALKDNVCEKMPRMGLRVKKYKDYYESVDGYGFLYGDNLKCGVANWINFREKNFTIYSNGSLFRSDDWREYKVDEYCLDTRYNTKAKTYTDIAIICEFQQILYAKWMILRVTVTLTCVCFVITIAVYVFIYKMQKLVEKIITCFCVIELIFWIMYALRIFYVPFGEFCTSFGYFYYFILMSRLSWLNVLSYEIWHTLGKTRSKVGDTPDTLRKKFGFYSIYAITLPFLCTIFFIMGDQEVYYLPESIRPYVNPAGCALDTTKIGNYGHYVHLYLPIGILIIINLVFYIKTVKHFLKIKSDLKKISDTNTSNQKRKAIKNNNKHGFIILKLGLVMGITWIYYMYDYITGFKNILILESIGDILRFSNVLEGLYFLIIFAVKWKTVREIFYKLDIIKRHRFATSTSTSSTASLTISNNESVNAVPMETLTV